MAHHKACIGGIHFVEDVRLLEDCCRCSDYDNCNNSRWTPDGLELENGTILFPNIQAQGSRGSKCTGRTAASREEIISVSLSRPAK